MTDLDEALQELYPQAELDELSLRRARARVLSQTRRRRTPKAVAAAAAVLLVLIAAAAVVRGRADPPGAMVEVAQTLNLAADAQTQNPDAPVPAGQYRYIATHMLSMSYGANWAFRLGMRYETWVPADPAGVWVQRRTDTGERTYLVGTPGPDGPPSFPVEVSRGPCGDFYPQAGVASCDRSGNWQEPTDRFIAELSRDPRKLYDRLRKDTGGHGKDPDQEVLVYAADALRGGLLPADLRAALYRALARLPALTVTERTTTLDGRTGTALGIVAAGERREIVIDPVTGAFIGERTVLTETRDGVPAGTVVASSSVTYRVVRTAG
ncbi:CU044_5270 family protein [Actinoplanes sp. NPDC026619]|uniref:CU044_5270 family protein n=1 Tax=Actinoplanes sp. NPDC026619 TaxID=3155798 RepID=UPI0033F34458